jgi:plastocyanin
MTGAEVRAAVAGATLVVVLALPGTAAAHPAAKTVEVRDGGYVPAYETVYPSQAVHWTWETLLASHSVTSHPPGQAEAFDSGIRTSGLYEHVFRTPGVYTYRSNGTSQITGTIEVLPYPTGPPKIKRLRVSNGSNAMAKFRANVRGDGVCRIEAREGGNWTTVKSFFKRVTKGRNRFGIPNSSLDAGRHRLTLRLYDRFNRLDSARDAFRL